MDYQRILADFQKDYYTQLIMFCVEVTALIIGITYVQKDKTSNLFLFYIAFDLIILLTNWVLQLSHTPIEQTEVFINITNVLIGLVELSVYFYFFRQILAGKGIQRWLIYSFLLYSAITLGNTILSIGEFTKYNRYIAYSAGALEFLLLLPPCFFYYYQLLNFTAGLSLKATPSFWIVTGIFFYSIISIPYYLLNTYIYSINHQYRNLTEAALYYIPFTINFIFLIKAFTCKKPLTI